jgi:hypothetical protein
MQSVSIDLSLGRECSFVMNIPDVEDSAATDVGGTVSKYRYSLQALAPLSVLPNKAISALMFAKC